MEENLHRSQEVLAKAQRIASLENRDWNLQTNCVVLSEKSRRIFEIPGNEIEFALSTDL